MFKTMSLITRKSGLSPEQFFDHYESHHARLGEKYFPTATHYARRYLRPVPSPVTGEAPEAEYDVATEMWFTDRSAFEAAMAAVPPSAIAEIAADEERFQDRGRNRTFFVEEQVSTPPGS